MKILPARTAPPPAPIERRHSPRPGRYSSSRSCLRWEFGHGCAFCLTHERDLLEHGVEGTGLTGVEHHLPQSRDPDGLLVHDYTNCFYACRFCNRARGDRPNVDGFGHVLRVEDRLLPTPGDPDARRTHQVYDLDDPRKRAMRRTRDEVLTEALRVLRDSPHVLARLLDLAAETASRRAELIAAARSLRALMLRARRDLTRFAAEPDDLDPACSCPNDASCCLPAFLAEQITDSPE